MLSIVGIPGVCWGADKGEAGEKGRGQTRKLLCDKPRSSNFIQQAGDRGLGSDGIKSVFEKGGSGIAN